jgi:hypothetical protein
MGETNSGGTGDGPMDIFDGGEHLLLSKNIIAGMEDSRDGGSAASKIKQNKSKRGRDPAISAAANSIFRPGREVPRLHGHNAMCV